MEPTARLAGMTKQGLVADALTNDIVSGKYRIGDWLPSEPELSQRFGVSRHTVRAALRTLRELGLVGSQQGIGTQVQEIRLLSRFSHSFNSADDLLQYATTTRVRDIGHEEIVLDATMAAQFGGKAGEHWWRVRTVRTEPSRGAVIAYSEIHIPLAFGAVLKEMSKGRQPIYALIQQHFHETITEIQQEIGCVASKPDEAAYLKVPAHSPVMEINRRYLGKNGRPLEAVRSVHPGELFKYSMRVQLRHGE